MDVIISIIFFLGVLYVIGWILFFISIWASNNEVAEIMEKRHRETEESYSPAAIAAEVAAKQELFNRGDYDLTCNYCHAKAKPIWGTQNRYRCESCGRQFVSSKHPF